MLSTIIFHRKISANTIALFIAFTDIRFIRFILFVPLHFLFAYSYSRFPVYFTTLLFNLFLILSLPEYLSVGSALILFCAPIFPSSPRQKRKTFLQNIIPQHVREQQQPLRRASLNL